MFLLLVKLLPSTPDLLVESVKRFAREDVAIRPATSSARCKCGIRGIVSLFRDRLAGLGGGVLKAVGDFGNAGIDRWSGPRRGRPRSRIATFSRQNLIESGLGRHIARVFMDRLSVEILGFNSRPAACASRAFRTQNVGLLGRLLPGQILGARQHSERAAARRRAFVCAHGLSRSRISSATCAARIAFCAANSSGLIPSGFTLRFGGYL